MRDHGTGDAIDAVKEWHLEKWPLFEYESEDKEEAGRIYESMDLDEWIERFSEMPAPFPNYLILHRNICVGYFDGWPLFRFTGGVSSLDGETATRVGLPRRAPQALHRVRVRPGVEVPRTTEGLPERREEGAEGHHRGIHRVRVCPGMR